ncbi:MAG: glycosyltransferase [Candidatus Bathyarchaeia archaeon]
MTLTSIYGTVYNNVKYIKRCLDSLVKALPNFDDEYELVIVDNYSTDGTFKILKKFCEMHKNVKLFRTRCTRGKGRDIALRNTSGEYVCTIDFDNIFEKEFGIILEKLKRVCTHGTFWSPYGFSTRKTCIEIIGGWKDLNYGEDWEFWARTIATGVIFKKICIPNFSQTENVKAREARYAKGFSFYNRKVRNIIDTIRGCNFNLSKEEFLIKKFTLTAFLALVLFPILKPLAFKYDEKLSNIEFIYKNEQLLFPEDFGLPINWFFTSWSYINFVLPIVKKRINELMRRDKKLELKYFKKRDMLVCTRDNHLIEKYLSYLF